MKKLLLISWMLVSGASAYAWQSAGNFEVRSVNKKNGIPSFIVFGSGAPTASGLETWFAGNFNTGSGFELRLQNTNKIKDDNYQERYFQYYKGIPVDGSMVNVQYRKGIAYSMSGTFYPKIETPVTAALSEAQALDKALALFPNAVFAWEQPGQEKLLQQVKKDPAASWYPKAVQVLVSRQQSQLPSDFRLAYRFPVYAVKPLAHKVIYIDALDGSVLAVKEQLQDIEVTATAHTKYSGIQTITCDSIAADSFVLQEMTRGDGVTIINAMRFTDFRVLNPFTNNSKVWNNVNIYKDEAATDVHWALEKTYDYYHSAFSRNSINDSGHILAGVLHFGEKFNNAFWNGSFATFGDGDDTTLDALTSVDVCAHEISHGLTEKTAALIYENESGALNESFSDIFGKSVEQYALPATFSWKVGEKIAMPGKQPFRDMKDPHTRLHPKYYGGRYYYTGVDDNGGVHTNSGVQNYWFYLLCEGGSGTREADGKPFTVTPIGMAKAAKIAYTNLTAYLSNFSSYSDAAIGGIEAAKALYGDTSAEAYETQMAWYAVGLAEMPEKPKGPEPSFVPSVAVGPVLSVYPNPVANFLNVSLKDMSGPVSLKLYTITGQVVYEQSGWKGGVCSLDMTTYPQGIYILEVKDQGAVVRAKVTRY